MKSIITESGVIPDDEFRSFLDTRQPGILSDAKLTCDRILSVSTVQIRSKFAECGNQISTKINEYYRNPMAALHRFLKSSDKIQRIKYALGHSGFQVSYVLLYPGQTYTYCMSSGCTHSYCNTLLSWIPSVLWIAWAVRI